MVMIENDSAGKLAPLHAEAHAWVRRLTSGEATAADAAALRQWCGRSPAHAAAFSEASQLWQAFGPAGRSLRHDETILNSARSSTAGRVMSRRALIGGALAASVAGVMVVRPPLGLWPSVFELAADYRTGTGEQRQLAAIDGLSIQMNTRTSLSIGAGAGADTVELIAGEASFRSERSGTLSVVAAGGRTTARNARFDVRVNGSTACVTCLTDDVRVEHLARSVTLTPRQQVAYDANGLGAVIAVDPLIVSAWQQGLIICNMRPLADVIEELNRYRSGRIVLLNAELGRNPVNGRFRIDQPDEALAQIERAFGVHRRTLPGGVVLLS